MNPSVRALLWSAWPRRISPCLHEPEYRTRNRCAIDATCELEPTERRALRFAEGMIFEGEVGAFGWPSALTRWITVAPFNKPELRSISDPLDLHAMPVVIASRAIALGQLIHIMTDSRHPLLELQRAKETLRIHDTHLGIVGNNLQQMLGLLETAVHYSTGYADYAAGEILAMLQRTALGASEFPQIVQRVNDLVGGVIYPAAPATRTCLSFSPPSS